MKPFSDAYGFLCGRQKQILFFAGIFLFGSGLFPLSANLLASPSGCSWQEIPLAPMEWDPEDFYRHAFMTFDESDCSHVIICDRQGAGLKLWKLLDGEWTKIWEGVPEIPLYFYYFGGAISCYYDKNLGSLCFGPSCLDTG